MAILSNPRRLFSVKWPKAPDHRSRSLSGVLVETNIQHQVALHFFNEVRELDEQVDYDQDGARQTEAREIVYVRELAETILLGNTAARQLRDVLLTLFPLEAEERLS
jgi:hypothetical protein